MGDGMEDLAGFGRAGEKLLDVISRGLGALYRPRAIRNEAKAHAEEVRLVGSAMNEVAVEKARMFARVEAENRVLLADTDEEILERARTRLVHREVQRQSNLDAITEKSFGQLPSDVSGDPVDDDWVRRFFNYAEDVGDDQMQLLWARILAGEVSNPGSFSLRTLNVVRNLTKKEAEFFRIACCLAFDDKLILQGPEATGDIRGYWLADFGLSYSRLLSLRDAGLIHNVEARAPYRAFVAGSELVGFSLAVPYHGRSIQLKPRNLGRSFELHCIPFTEAGRQLWPFVTREEVPGFIEHIANALDCDIGSDLDPAAFAFEVPTESPPQHPSTR